MTDPIRIVCTWRESKDFPIASVFNLFKCCRQAAGSREIEFHCLTTHDHDLPEPIITHHSEHPEWVKFWSKIELFRGDLFPNGVIYFDLDTIVNDLSRVPSFEDDNSMWMIKDVKNRRRWASGVMAWRSPYPEPFYHELLKWREERHFSSAGRRREWSRPAPASDWPGPRC